MGTPNSIPYEVIASPFEVWVAPVGTTFPAIDAVPADPWARVGTSGNLSYTEDGIKAQLSQTLVEWASAGDVGTRKVFRTGEKFTVGLTLADMTLEQLRHALNMNPVTDVPAASGVAGYRQIGLSRGSSVAQRAVMIRGASPYGDDMTAQFEIPIAFQTGEPELVLGKKGEPTGLALEWTAIIDPNAANDKERFGRMKGQTSAAL